MKAQTSMIYKAIHYAYPSSENAKGFPGGCWCVSALRKSRKGYKQKLMAQFDDKARAIAYAKTLPNNWHPFTM